MFLAVLEYLVVSPRKRTISSALFFFFTVLTSQQGIELFGYKLIVMINSHPNSRIELFTVRY